MLGNPYGASGGLDIGRAPFWCAPLRSSIIDGGRVIEPRELDERISSRADELGAGSLVALSGHNGIETVVTYLACLRIGAPVIVTGDDQTTVESLVATYEPGIVVRCDRPTSGEADSPVRIERRHRDTAPDLHPDLAVLLSTSGSTGAPKLVRLSRRNVASNAAAIAEYLQLDERDRATTSLPLHYCYGLSVLGSHLSAGSDVVLTNLSVVDPCFWQEARDHEVTTISGVPHTFELLDRIGFDGSELPSLRRLTQAGGRMPPERVRRFAHLGAQHGFDLYIMYGQTEATARMAYLPPGLAASRPTAVGRAIPGGALSTRPLPAEEAPSWPSDCGEVLYRGPNVMMGYAERSADLALPPGDDLLPTGDVGRIDEEGLLEIVGRRGRFTKIFGLRIDLDVLERRLATAGAPAWCDGDDERVTCLVPEGAAPRTARLVHDITRLPRSRIRCIEAGDALPRAANGKPDRSLLRSPPDVRGERSHPDHRHGSVAEAYLAVLEVDRVDPSDTFVALGGDSLSYVEMSIVLEDLLGHLPRDWHLMTVAALEHGHVARARRTFARVETGAVLRAVAIVLVVGNHMGVTRLPGGAHVLLAVAGFNLARFAIDGSAAGRGRRAVRSVAVIAAPTVVWVGAWTLLSDRYGWPNLAFVNNLFDDPPAAQAWRFWFIEVLLHCTVLVAVVFAFAPVRKLERAAPFSFAATLLAVTLVGRFAPLEPDRYYLFRTHRVAWILAFGWAAQRATTTTHRVMLSGVALAATSGFSTVGVRNEVMAVGLLALVWFPAVALPRQLRCAVVALGGSSLGIYLVHSEIYPMVQDVVGNGMLALTIVMAISVLLGSALTSATGATIRRLPPVRWLPVRWLPVRWLPARRPEVTAS